jgi:SAM-dependent methyltransferase
VVANAIPNASDELTAAFTQVMSSLGNLANNCRKQGIDPMAALVGMLFGPAGTGRDCIDAALPSDAEIIERSHHLIEALERGDVAAVAASIAPDFIRFVEGTAIGRETLLLILTQLRSNVPRIATRTWNDEKVLRLDNTLVFIGMACEVQGGNHSKGGYLHEGQYFLQWIRVGDAWRAQLLTWQRLATDRDVYNEIFRKGRGFSRKPNRLLVDTIKNETPGAALDLAMGQGRNALYLASQGWRVTGVDGSDEGLQLAREEAARRGVALETIHADIDRWDFGENHFDLVTMMYAGDHARWIDKIKASLREGGLFVVEGWAKGSPDSPNGFSVGQLAKLFEGYDILRDDVVEDVPDWAWDDGTLVRFVARKR